MGTVLIIIIIIIIIIILTEGDMIIEGGKTGDGIGLEGGDNK